MSEYRVPQDDDEKKSNTSSTTNNASNNTTITIENDRLKQEQQKKEINNILSTLLIQLQNQQYETETISIPTSPAPPSSQNFILLDQVRLAYRKSIYGNRTNDATGKVKKAFGFLVKPSTHLVALQPTTTDIIFTDDYTCAERCKCIDFWNTYNLIYTILRFTLFLLVSPWLFLLVPFVMTNMYVPTPAFGVVLKIFWVILHCSDSIWQISYICCYGHIQCMKEICQANAMYSFWLIGSALSYTISCILYSPTIYNIPAVINFSLIITLHKFFFGSTIIFFKQRQTRKNYETFFVPKGCFAKLWIFLDTNEMLADMLRHLAVLYSVQATMEANGVLDQENVIGLTVAGKAFQLTLKQIMNTSYTVSLIFRFSALIQGMVKGDLGTKISNLGQIVNIE